MIRKRSRTVSNSGKATLTPDNLFTSVPSLTSNQPRHLTSSLFQSPAKHFIGLSAKSNSMDSSESTTRSPTSLVETKIFSSSFKNTFFSDRKSITQVPTTAVETKHEFWGNGETKAIGLGLVDVLSKENSDPNSQKPQSRMVILGSQLKIQIPVVGSNSVSPTGSTECVHSPIEFGIKNRDSQLALYSPAHRSPSLARDGVNSSPRVLTGSLSPREMELSEDYTCVIMHGPNPKTTHIFDNCIVESYGGDEFVMLSKNNNNSSSDLLSYSSDDFLSFCHACKKNLEQGKHVFMYRGEQAFCSKECRYQEMLFDDEMDKCTKEEPSFSL